MRLFNNTSAPRIWLASILCRFFWAWWESKEQLLTSTSYYSSLFIFLISGHWNMTVKMNMNLSWFNNQRNKDSVVFINNRRKPQRNILQRLQTVLSFLNFMFKEGWELFPYLLPRHLNQTVQRFDWSILFQISHNQYSLWQMLQESYNT